MKRYKELKFEDKSYTEPYKIDEILIKNKFEWFLDCEIENARIEISKNTLIFNSGVFFNGTWVYGVFRDGQWKYGTWEGGVWYNGTWDNGIFKNGIIFNGRFKAGKIEGGEIRGGEFFDCEIGHDVVKNIAQPNKNSPKPQQGQPQNRGIEQKVQGQVQPVQPKVQPQKIEERIKRYVTFINEGKMEKQKALFKEIEEYEKEHKIKRNQGGIIDGSGKHLKDEVFTTSEQTDIWEMIEDGWTKEEIINRIKKW